MKIFLIWAAEYKEIEYLMRKLKNGGHEIAYWVGTSVAGGEENLKNTVFHNHYSAWVGNPAEGIDINDFPPPGKELIERMYKTESTILTMMNKKFNNLCVDERRHIYYQMLRYWQGVLKKYQPDAIVFSVTPHTVYDFVIFKIAQMLNIKTIMFAETGILNRCFMYEDWQNGSDRIRERIRANSGKNFSVEDLSQDLREFYLNKIDPSIDSIPWYMEYQKKKFSGKNFYIRKFKALFGSIKDGTIFKKLPSYFAKIKENLKKEYEKLQSSPDLKQKFIYIPLNYQPERTSCPEGDMFADQILMVEIVAASLPKEWVIYVKEHPSQWWMRSGTNYSSTRYKGYYERLARIPGVILVPIHTKSSELIEKCQAVATVTGTAGWEALFRLKPALVFGYPWYRDCGEVFMARNVEACKEAFNKIEQGYKVDRQKIVNFLKSFDESAVKFINARARDFVVLDEKDERILEIANWLG
ncbi:MAG TPA: hypothetical protein VJH05_01065 [Candidatus Paceibacterota bacterium]